MSDYEYEFEEDRIFFQRHSAIISMGAILLFGAAIFYTAKALSNGHQASVRSAEISIVLPQLPPPPPKPKPTPTPVQQPTPEPLQEQKLVEQQPVQDEKKPEAPKEKPLDTPAPLGTSITGPGGGPD